MHIQSAMDYYDGLLEKGEEGIMPKDLHSEMRVQANNGPGIAIHSECPHHIPTHTISNKIVATRVGVCVVRIQFGKVVGNVR